MNNKPQLPIEFLNGSIEHIENMVSESERVLGKKNILANAIISMDIGGHSYDYTELVNMQRDLLNDSMHMTSTATVASTAWDIDPDQVLKDLRIAHDKMTALEDARTELLNGIAEHCQDLFMEAQRMMEDGAPLPRPFLCEEYFASRGMRPEWPIKIYPMIMPNPTRVEVILTRDI